MKHVCTLDQIHQFQGQQATFQGQLVGICQLLSQNGKRYYRLTLEHSGTTCYCHVWPETNHLYSHMTLLDVSQRPLLEVTGRIQSLDNRPMCRVGDISILEPSAMGSMPGVVIPLRARQAHEALWQHIESVPMPALRRFMQQVLADTEIYPGFVSARASESSHHAFAGGLLVHSVQVGRLVELMGRELGMADDELHLSIVGGLLHDVGKVHTVGYANPRPMPPKLYRHEVRSIFLLAPHMAQLRAEWAEGAWVLEHLLDRMIANPDKRGTLFIGEDLIKHADQASAANQCHKSLTDFMKEGSYAQWHPANQSDYVWPDTGQDASHG